MDGIVVLEDEMAERFNVEVDSMVVQPLGESLRCSAVIERAAGSEGVVAAPASGIVHYRASVGQTVGRGAVIATITPNAAGNASVKAAQSEVDRLRPLFVEKLVTAAEWQAALATLEQAKAGYSPASATAPIGGMVEQIMAPEGSYVEIGAPIASLVSDGNLTLTAKVGSENYARLKSITDAYVQLPDGESVLLSSLGGSKSGVSAAGGYATVTFTFNNNGRLAPGATVEAWLRGTGTEQGLSVPRSALIEQQGQYFVFRQVMPEHYEKVLVSLGPSDGERVRILSGIEAGDRIVTRSATTLRLAEAAGTIPEGHNHNH